MIKKRAGKEIRLTRVNELFIRKREVSCWRTKQSPLYWRTLNPLKLQNWNSMPLKVQLTISNRLTIFKKITLCREKKKQIFNEMSSKIRNYRDKSQCFSLFLFVSLLAIIWPLVYADPYWIWVWFDDTAVFDVGAVFDVCWLSSGLLWCADDASPTFVVHVDSVNL